MNRGFRIWDEDLRFEFDSSCPPIMHSDTLGYITEFTCKALYRVYEDEDDIEGEEKLVGKLSGYRLALNNCYHAVYGFEDEKDYIDPVELLDMIDEEVAKLITLFEDGWNIKTKYQKKFQNIPEIEYEPPNIVFIKRIEVVAEYRGRKFGKAIISNSLNTIAKQYDLVMLRSMPLQLEFVHDHKDIQWHKEMNLTNLEKNEEAAQKKLDNYYKKLGFKLLLKQEKLFFLPLLFRI